MVHNDLPEIVRLRVEAHKHGLLLDDVGRAADRTLDLGIDDEFSRNLVRSRVEKHRIAQAFSGPFEVPPPLQGEVILGLDQRGRRVGVPAASLNAHVMVLGGSGAGKTNRSYFHALAIAGHVEGMWLFDLRKAEFRLLSVAMKRLGIELIRVPARSLRLNPLQVPIGVVPGAWAADVADMLVHVLSLQQRSSKLIHAAILELYDRFDVRDAPAGRDPSVRYPTLYDLRDAVLTWKDANPQARSAIVDALDPVLRSLGPEVLGYSFGWTTQDLARHHIALELVSVARHEQDLLIGTLLLAEFTSRVAQGMSNAAMSLYILIDEAQRLVSASNPSAVISQMLGLVRGAGVGVDLSFQGSHDVHPSVFSNTATKIIGRVGSATDLDAVGAAMALNQDQRRCALQHLRPGLFIAQLGEGAWRKPFLLTVPLVRLRDMSPDESPVTVLKMLPTQPHTRRHGT